ncbi:hypothetical protein pipiens_011063 [Culex pipiens pipiens]|uniref:Secreted protein n=1 Tax=Culex pipiens pipiens TaxID=38569 RepID=A0ABD1D7R5_CULPP
MVVVALVVSMPMVVVVILQVMLQVVQMRVKVVMVQHAGKPCHLVTRTRRELAFRGMMGLGYEDWVNCSVLTVGQVTWGRCMWEGSGPGNLSHRALPHHWYGC